MATARERHGRAEADIGLFEERLSEITRNRALATKDKMAALSQLVETIGKFGELETKMKMNDIEQFDARQEGKEDIEKIDAKRTAMSNDFLSEIITGQQNQQNPMQQNQEPMNQMQEMLR